MIYIDSEFHCHLTDDGTRTPVETDFFAGKCDAFIEGYCYEPRGETQLVYPWKPHIGLETAQRQYEQAVMADMKTALHTLGVTLDG